MKIVSKFWQNFKTQPDIWFFYGFLLTFTLSIKKVLFFYPINGQFNEYSGIYLYLSDIFLTLTLILWLSSILCNNIDYLSIYRSVINALNKPIYFIPVLLAAWSFISILWSQNTSITLFRSFKLLGLYLLYIYIISRFSPFKKERLRRICKIIIILGFIQALIGIIQFAIQHSIGIFWLKESLISPDLLGVAKIILNGHKIIRSYGLFPHPNILGGFLVSSILITLVYKRMFHANLKKECSNPNSKDCSTWNNLTTGQAWNINHSKLLPIFIFIQLISLILTFSKSAIIGLLISMAYVSYKHKVNVPPQKKCSMWNILRDKHGTLIKQAVIISLIIILAFFLIKPDIYSFFIKSLDERYLYLNVSRGTIFANPIIGLGMGQFVLEMQKYSKVILEIWQFQPVHNVFLLIWAELGIVGLFIFIAFLWKLFRKEDCHSGLACPIVAVDPESRKLNKEILKQVQDDKINYIIYFKSILIAFIFIMLFDHYSWDIQQGQIMLWMTMGLIVGLNYKRNLT